MKSTTASIKILEITRLVDVRGESDVDVAKNLVGSVGIGEIIVSVVLDTSHISVPLD